MAGKHRAKTVRRQPEAYVWLGTGAITLALGAALVGGSGVASADTTGSTNSGSRVSPPGKSGPTTSIRTTVSAQSVNTSTHSSRPAPKPAQGEDRTTSVVSHKDSVVRDQNPAVTGDNNPGPGPTVAETVIGSTTVISEYSRAFRASRRPRTFRSSILVVAGAAACSRRSRVHFPAACSSATLLRSALARRPRSPSLQRVSRRDPNLGTP